MTMDRGRGLDTVVEGEEDSQMGRVDLHCQPTSLPELYQSLVQSFLTGSPHPSSSPRPSLPLELIRQIVRHANLSLPVPNRTLSVSTRTYTPLLTMSHRPFVIWFSTPPLTKERLSRFCGVSVVTVGRQTSGCGYIGAMYGHSNGQSVGNRVEGDHWRKRRIQMGRPNPHDKQFGYFIAILQSEEEEQKNESVDGGGHDSNWLPTIYNSPFYTYTPNIVSRHIKSRPDDSSLLWFSHFPAPSWHLASSFSTSPSSPMREHLFMHRMKGPVFGPEHEIWEWVEVGDRIAVVAGWECEGERAEMKFQEYFDVEKSV